MPAEPQMRVVWIVVCFVLILMCDGCIRMMRLPSQPPVSYSASAKIELEVELRLTREFKSAQFEKRVVAERWRTPLGPPLSVHCEQLARTLFVSVVVTQRSVSSAIEPGVDAVLIPKVVSVDQVVGKTTLSDSVLTVALEWSLKDRKDHLIWVETVIGEGKGNLWNDEKRGRELIDDLFKRSYQSILSSIEIREFAEKRDLRR